MRIFDTHAHLLSHDFDSDRAALLKSLRTRGVELVMEACCTEADIPKILAFTKEHDWVYGSAGLHPEELDKVGADPLNRWKRLCHGKKSWPWGRLALTTTGKTIPNERCRRRIWTPSFPWREPITCL